MKLSKLVFRVIAIFLVFELVIQIFGSLLAGGIWSMIFYGKYTTYLLSEAVVLLFALVLLKILKHTNILKDKNMSFTDSIKLGMPILVIAIVYFFINALSLVGTSINLANLFSLIIYAILVGLFEEIFFRGIIQNELVKNYGDSRKKIIISIIISSIIFGCVHFTNLLYGQDLLTTLMQVIQTSAVGLVLGSAYFISNNIWSVIFLHSFYDFAILLSEVNSIKDCSYADVVPTSVSIYSLVISLILSLIYIIYSLRNLSKSKIDKRLNLSVSEEEVEKDKQQTKKFNIILVILVILFFSVSIIFTLFFESSEEYYVCYTYQELEIDKYELHYYSYNDYTTFINGISTNIYLEDNNVYISYLDTLISLGFNNAVRVFLTDNSLMIITYNLGEYELYYTDDLSDLDNISNSLLKFEIPAYMYGGYLLDSTTGDTYPMIISETYDMFIIKNKEIYLVN